LGGWASVVLLSPAALPRIAFQRYPAQPHFVRATTDWMPHPWHFHGWAAMLPRSQDFLRTCISAVRILSTYRKLLIRITSLLSLPFASSNCLPSRDHAKLNISPDANLVMGCGSPPASGCSQILVAPLRVSRN